MNITLPEHIAKQLEGRVQASKDFQSIEQYVIYVLEEVLKQTEGEHTYTKEQEDAVKERLENLGYLE